MIKLSFPSTRDRLGYGKRHQSANSSGVNLKAFNEALGAATAGDDTPPKVPKEYPVTAVDTGDEDGKVETLQSDPGFGESTVREQAQEVIRATKLGISSYEYRARKRMVREAYKQCKLQVGDTCYPAYLEDRNKYGKMIVTAICDDFDSYGDVEWNNNPLIVCVSPLNDRNSTVNCSHNWVIATSGGKHGVC